MEEHGGKFGLGKPNAPFGMHFTGQSYMKTLSDDNATLAIWNITYEPACRSEWHVHTSDKGGGQVIICVDGNGWYQEEGKTAKALKEGDVIEIPPGVNHWHGATADSWFSHVTFEIPGENCGIEWKGFVTDEQYDLLK